MPRFDAPLEAYVREADGLLSGVRQEAFPALQRVLAWHPTYTGGPLAAIPCDTFDAGAARQTIACEYGCDTWNDLSQLVAGIGEGGTVRTFERAAEAVATGDLEGLDRLLREEPWLAQARSSRRHRATLLHYLAANGVEPPRQSGSPLAVAIAARLLDAGAEVDAVARFYDEDATTLGLVVSTSSLGDVQRPLALLLAIRGAALDSPGRRWPSAVLTALAFGHAGTAAALAARRSSFGSLPEAAGLGRGDDVDRLLASATADDRHLALALAAAHGHTAVVARLLAEGVDPNRPNPAGFHGHSMPIHQAVWAGNGDTVAALVAGGARLDVRDSIYDGTPLDWAEHSGRRDLATWLRGRV